MKAIIRRSVCAALVCGSAARADVLLSNYPIANDTGTTAQVNNLRRKALEFTMPAGHVYHVTSVTLRLGNFDGTDTAHLEIRDHNGTSTSTGPNVIGAFTAPVSGGTAIADHIFTPVGTVALQPGTKYWLYLYGAASPSSFDWRGSSPAIVPAGIATFGPGSLFTTNSGSTWAVSATVNSFILDGVRPGEVCYANCDASTATPVLNVADFTCFLGKFAASDGYANCDSSTAEPTLNVADFTCFLSKFAAGCP